MKRVNGVLTSIVALLVGISTATAADLYNPVNGSLKDPVGSGQICGFYAEASIGPGFTQNNTGVSSLSGVSGTTLSETGGIGVFTTGYDKCNIAGRFGLGIYGEVSDNFDVNGKVGNVNGKTSNFITFGENYSWGVGGKLFYDHGLGQIYTKLGWAETQDDVNSVVKTYNGFLWGTGISLKITGNVYAKMEFDQIHYTDASTFVFKTPIKWDQVDDRLLFGIGYSLGH